MKSFQQKNRFQFFHWTRTIVVRFRICIHNDFFNMFFFFEQSTAFSYHYHLVYYNTIRNWHVYRYSTNHRI